MMATLGRAAVMISAVALASGCSGTAEADKRVTTPSGASYLDIKEGQGEPANFGDVIFFTYTGKLSDGKQFEKRERNNAAHNRLGFRAPIVGLDEGLDGIKEGGIRTIWVPAKAGYGTIGATNIPPNTDLVFENVEVLRIARPTPEAKEAAKKTAEKRQAAAKELEARRAEDAARVETGKDVPEAEQKVVTLPSGLKYKDVRIGDGPEAHRGSEVVVLYVGRLTDGKVFDSRQDANEPFHFRLDKGDVIKGWDEGLLGMKAGGKRSLTIPPDLGYGGAEIPGIPANSTLLFDVQLLKVF